MSRYIQVYEVFCAQCLGPTYRVPRRWSDRLKSLVEPCSRYRCRDLLCGWEGTVASRFLQFPRVEIAPVRTLAVESREVEVARIEVVPSAEQKVSEYA